MARYKDSGYKYLMSRVTLGDAGSDVYGEEEDVEELFYGLVVESVSGLELLGSPRTYSESYAESDKSFVYVPSGGQCASSSITLKVYFFDPASSKTDAVTSIAKIDALYHDFLEFVSGCRLMYRDTVRKRKVLMYMSSAPKVSTDRVVLPCYKEIELTFTNVYGRSFGYDESFPE